jgi:hypothetical protein
LNRFWVLAALGHDCNYVRQRKALIPEAGKQFSLLTHIATAESVSLCALMKSCRRLWNSKRRFEIAATDDPHQH